MDNKTLLDHGMRMGGRNGAVTVNADEHNEDMANEAEVACIPDRFSVFTWRLYDRAYRRTKVRRGCEAR